MIARRTGRLLVAVTVLAGCGCSARSGYEGLRAGAVNDCATQPPSMYGECIERTRMDYDEYQRRVREAEEAAD